jgi:plastocyanin
MVKFMVSSVLTIRPLSARRPAPGQSDRPLRRTLAGLALAAAALVVTAPAAAADLVVQVSGVDGKPVENAVVVLRPSAGRPSGGPIRFAWDYAMVQQHIRFEPFVLIVPTGAEVSFPNRDKVRHHVYSFSATKKFELKLYGREEQRKVLMDKAGVVALGCNIHDQMIGYIFVTDTPLTAKTDAQGLATLRGAPGPGTLTIWHPYLKAARNQITQPSRGVGRESATLDLRPAAPAR